MKAWASWASLVCAAGALLLAPACAGAKPGYVVSPGDHRVELNLKGSHGYSVRIVEHNRRFLEVFAYKNPSVVVYLIRHAALRGDGIDAELPGVGQVSVQFRPMGPAHKEPGFFPPCAGGEIIKQPGHFVGRIRLRGERGYTVVHATQVRGQIVATAKEICKRSLFNEDPEPKPELGVTRLFAYSRSEGREVEFYGSTLTTPDLSPPTSTFFSGSVTEQRKGMAIFREAVARGTGGDLAPGDGGDFPLSATVTPADPFYGSAVFQRNSGGNNSWSGPLSVILPGLGRVALAGPHFSSRLCHSSGCIH